MKVFAAPYRLSAFAALMPALGLCLALACPTSAQELQAPANLKPIPNGPGIQICEPVASGGTAALADFGSGCGLWLQWAMGFQPQLGQTPRWELAASAHKEIQSKRLRLSLAQASKLYNIQGVTHVAIGKIAGTPEKCQLTYQIYEVPAQKTVGAPIKLSGSEVQILAQLPGAARTILTTLGVQPGHVPAGVGATPAEITTVGGYPWFPDQKPTVAQQQQIDTLGQKLPLATLLSYEHHQPPTEKEKVAAALHLLGQASGNFLMVGAVITSTNHLSFELVAPLDKQVAAIAAPNNVVLSFWAVSRPMTQRESLEALERTVRLVPHSSNAWYILAVHYGEQGGIVRQARVAANLTDRENKQLADIYSRWYYAATQATTLDADSEDAWRELAEAATFYGDPAHADDAFWKAMRLNKDDVELYWWGLEMYQSKWGGNPATLNRVVHLCMTNAFPPGSDLYRLGVELQSAGFSAEANTLCARGIAQQRATIRQNPKNAYAHAVLGTYLTRQGKTAEAEAELKTAIRLDPDSSLARSNLALLYRKQNKVNEANTLYAGSVQGVGDVGAKTTLAEQMMHNSKDPKLAEPQKILTEVLKIQPTNYRANEDMGWLLAAKKEYDAALKSYGVAAKLKPNYELPHREMGRIYRLQSKFDAAIWEGQTAVTLAPKNRSTLSYLADTYAAKGDNDNALKLYRQAVDAAPTYAQGHLDLGAFLLKIGKKAEGRAELQRVLQGNAAPNVKKAAQDLLNKNP